MPTIVFIADNIELHGLTLDIIDVINGLIEIKKHVILVTDKVSVRSRLDSRVEIITVSDNVIARLENIVKTGNKVTINVTSDYGYQLLCKLKGSIGKKENIKVYCYFDYTQVIKGKLQFMDKICTLCTRIIVNNHQLRDFLINFYNADYAKINILQPVIDIDKFSESNVTDVRLKNILQQLQLEVNSDKKILLFCGDIDKIFDHQTALSAMQYLKNHFIYVIIGKAENNLLFGNLIRNIKKYDLTSSIKIINSVNDYPALYTVSYVNIILTTDVLVYSKSHIESASIGVPSIVSRGVNSDAIVDNKTGWIIEPNNVEHLISTIESILQMKPTVWATVKNNARRHIVSYYNNNSKYLKHLKSLYDEES